MATNTVTDLVVNQYIRQPVPQNPEGMAVYLSGQLQEIENSMKTVGEGSLQVVDSPPARPLKGMLRYAVTPWDPLGNGFQGLVVYSGSAWIRASDPDGTISSLSTTVSSLNTSVTTNVSAISGIEAKNTVKIDNNGHISGYGLISTANNGTPTATFNVSADAFKIGSPSSASTVTPFSVYTGSRTVDGVTVPAGTYIENAFITSAAIKTLNADTITAGNLSASRLTLDGSTITANGSGQLIVADSGISTDKIASGAVNQTVTTSATQTFSLAANGTKTVTVSLTGCTAGSQILVLFNYLAVCATANQTFDITGTNNPSSSSFDSTVIGAQAPTSIPLPSAYVLRTTASAGTNTVGVTISTGSSNSATIVGLVYGLSAQEVKR